MKKRKKNNNHPHHHHQPLFSTTIIPKIYDSNNEDSNKILEKTTNNLMIAYDDRQRQQKPENIEEIPLLIQQMIVASISFNVVWHLIYSYIIKYEAEALIEDVKRIKKRFASNAYSRIANEVNIFIVNSIEINSFEDSYKCLLAGYTKYFNIEDSQNLVSEIINKAFDTSDFNLEFFLQIYINAIKQTIYLGPSLLTLKKFVIPTIDLDYQPDEKNNLRGAHSQLKHLRSIYNSKMNYYYSYESSSSTGFKQNTNEAFKKFTDKIKTLMINPEMMMCNHISSQNSINIKNFKENFMNVNQIAVKDLYNNILDTTDGIISMRIQNSITKSVYLVGFFFITVICMTIFKTIKKRFF